MRRTLNPAGYSNISDCVTMATNTTERKRPTGSPPARVPVVRLPQAISEIWWNRSLHKKDFVFATCCSSSTICHASSKIRPRVMRAITELREKAVEEWLQWSVAMLYNDCLMTDALSSKLFWPISDAWPQVLKSHRISIGRNENLLSDVLLRQNIERHINSCKTLPLTAASWLTQQNQAVYYQGYVSFCPLILCYYVTCFY